jgi:hypothetical protein
VSPCPSISPTPCPRISLSHSGLTLVGTVHADDQGFSRTECLLRSLQPDLFLVELSPYGKTFRSSNQVVMQEVLDRNLRVAAEKCRLPFKDALTHPEIKAVRRQIVLPFEYRAAWRYSRARGTELLLVDFSSFSRRMISSWPEMLSSENLATLLSLPRDSRLAITKAYDFAERGLRGESPTMACIAETSDPETDPFWNKRERHMAGAIRSALRKRRPMRPVYLGGWQHLTVGGRFPSLRELLGIDLRQCYLLDRGLL